MRTLVVNLFGGPSSDKATQMGGLYFKLMQAGYLCHCLPESPPTMWEKPSTVLATAKQFERLLNLEGQVDAVVTDNPLLQSLAYACASYCTRNWRRHVWDLHHHFRNVNVLLYRTKDSLFKEVDSALTFSECFAKDQEITRLLQEAHEPFHLVFADADAVDKITDIVVRKILSAS